jgi:hypothetical protein
MEVPLAFMVFLNGFPYSTRMTVIQLSDGRLWIHSPERLNDELKEALKNIDEVGYLISPNKLHHLFLTEWISVYPNAKPYAAPGLIEKRPDITFSKELSGIPEKGWGTDIEQAIFQGSPAMEEMVFFHKSSKTLILTDLIENFDASVFTWWQKPIAWIGGILSPNGKTPLDWRLSFLLGKKRARVTYNKMLGWEPQNIILSHGKCIIGGGQDFLKKSFKWLQ